MSEPVQETETAERLRADLSRVQSQLDDSLSEARAYQSGIEALRGEIEMMRGLSRAAELEGIEWDGWIEGDDKEYVT